MSSPRSQNPFLLVLLIVGLLAGLSFLKPGLTIGGVPLRPVRLLADVLRKDSAAASLATAAGGLTPPPPNGAAGPPVATDTAGVRAALAADSLALARETAARTKAKGPAQANLPGLDSFLAALRATKATGSQTRIAYFGDSMIEGDLLTGDLRNLLQTTFGGTGVGFVPVNSITADFRETIHESFSPDWYEYNLLSDRHPAGVPLGVSGHAFLPREVSNPDSSGVRADTSWVQFRAGQRFATTRRFVSARLFYGPGARRDQVLVTTDGHRVPHPLPGTAPLNELLLKPGTPARTMRLAFATHGPRPVYGVSFESPQGVVLDNFSFRGNSGMSLTKIPYAQLAAFGPALDYRLIILHYGVNVANARVKDYSFYERAMTRVVDRMQRAFPNASILIVGMSDKSTRIDGEFVTDPSVPRLLEAQQRLARRTHAAFWNLFEAMGGENTMTSWVEQSPPLANKDYTHINSRGGRKIAGLLYDYLMGEYAHPGTTPAPSLAKPTPNRPDSAASPAASASR